VGRTHPCRHQSAWPGLLESYPLADDSAATSPGANVATPRITATRTGREAFAYHAYSRRLRAVAENVEKKVPDGYRPCPRTVGKANYSTRPQRKRAAAAPVSVVPATIALDTAVSDNVSGSITAEIARQLYVHRASDASEASGSECAGFNVLGSG
jgi:hypothetical protein